jgi:hypothetical protein
MPDAIVAEGLAKRYGDVVALDGMALSVPEGSVFGLVGPGNTHPATPLADAWPLQHPVLASLLWIALLHAVFVPMASLRYRKAVSC